MVPELLREAAVTEAEALRVLYQAYQHRKMVNAVVPHAALGLAHASNWHGDAEPEDTIRYIDALVLFRDKRWAVEVKVTRGDLARELAVPVKSAAWRAHVHGFYVAVPPDLVEHAVATVPRDFAGIMRLTSFPQVVRRSTVNRQPHDLPYDTWRRIARKGSRAHFAEPRAATLQGVI